MPMQQTSTLFFIEDNTDDSHLELMHSLLLDSEFDGFISVDKLTYQAPQRVTNYVLQLIRNS
jgi:hypothetical protein